jgi:hypothetical protein
VIGLVGAAFNTVLPAIELMVIRVAHAFTSLASIVDRLLFGGKDSKVLEERLEGLRRRAAILGGTIDQAFANALATSQSWLTEALRDLDRCKPWPWLQKPIEATGLSSGTN